MAEEWHISRGSRMCSRSGKRIEAGEPYFSALVEEADVFQRRDFSSEAWPEVDKAAFFSYWKNKGWSEKDDGKARPIDYERVLAFFDDLAGAEEPHRRLFRYVVALMLSRRRILRLDGISKTPEGDLLVLYDKRVQSTLEVPAPEATPEQLRHVQDRLNALFDLDGDEAGG